jgi:Xaa-Pro aminopeptidase
MVQPPFDADRLDALLEDADVDLVLATSHLNVRYLLGGHYFWLKRFSHATGPTAWIPFVGYPAGRRDEAFYVGNSYEGWQQQVKPIWVPDIANVAMTFEDAIAPTAARIEALGLATGTIAVEQVFLPAAALEMLRRALPRATFVEANRILERQRAIKTDDEIALLRRGTDAIAEAMIAVFQGVEAGATTREITTRLATEEAARGIDFDFCLIATGTSTVRVPSVDRWLDGGMLSLDSGGFFHGFLADVARMGVRGTPSQELQDILGEIEAVQSAVADVAAAGVPGTEVVRAGTDALARCAHRDSMFLDIHGLGLVTHEVPRLMPLGTVAPDHVEEELQARMILSIETTFSRDGFGFVKLEDTVLVTDTGTELMGDLGRGWNVA